MSFREKPGTLWTPEDIENAYTEVRAMRLLVSIAYRYGFQGDSAIEIVCDFISDKFLDVVRGYDPGKGSWGSYLCAAFRHYCYARLREMGRLEQLEPDSFAAIASPVNVANSVIAKIDYERCFLRLSPKRQQVIYLIDAEGYTHQEVATQLGEQRITVTQRYLRAKRQLRRCLEKCN